MKNKPKRHKAENTFKFQKFSERISNINIDVFHKVKHPYEENDEDTRPHYSQCLNKWINENFSPDFIELSRKLPKDIYSLPQLLAQINDIISSLVSHLKCCDTDALQPALEIIVALANDLGKEFYSFFCPSVLRECVRLLDTREPDQIEWVFTCLAHLFKQLWVPIVNNINSILPELLPLLNCSQPKYINNFAAESFAFVARKVRDKSQFLRLSLKNVKNNAEELIGMARLYYEVVTNVGNQFHSGAEELLVIMFTELDNRKWSETLFTICESLMSNLITFVTATTNVSPIWRSLLRVANAFHSKWSKEYDAHSAENLTMLMKLVLPLVASRKPILPDPEELLTFLVKLTTDRRVETFFELHSIVIDLVSHLLVDQKYSIKLKNCEEIIVQVTRNIHNEKLLVQFVENLVRHAKHERLAFDELLKFVSDNGLNEYLVQFLAKVIWIKTDLRIEECKQTLMFYSDCLRSMPESLTQYLVDHIDVSSDRILDTSEKSLLSILVLSHHEKSRTASIRRVDRFLTRLCELIDRTENIEHVAKLLYILLIAFQSRRLTNLQSYEPFEDELTRLSMRYANSSNFLCSLRILDTLPSFNRFECVNSEDGKTPLINNLCSPFHKVRLFTLQVLSKMNECHPVFGEMMEIEMIVPSIDTYQEKLRKLQRLEYNDGFAAKDDDLAKTAVLKFLFGNLYISFSYLWEPTQKLILSHLENSRVAWEVFEDQLCRATVNDMNSAKLMENLNVSFECEFLQQHFYTLNGVDDRLDFYTFRCLLLDVLSNCRTMGFTNKHFISKLFLEFYNSEYTASVHEFRLLCNIKKLDRISEDLSESQDESQSTADKESNHDKNLNKLFIILLKLVGNTSYQLPAELRSNVFDIHFELLSNGNSAIQQAAVNYVCKAQKLAAYKERLLLLTTENTFKNELLNIRIDFHSDLIPELDKPSFMKIVLKIIYGKVRKKSAVHLRDAMFEFLAGCSDGDVISFFDMFFKQFSSTVKDSISPLTYADEDIDLENTVSPSCLSAYVNTAVDLLKRCGKLLKRPCLSYLLRVILKVAANLVALLGKRAEIHSGYYGLLSKIRVGSFEAIIFFVDNFEYRWESEEINAVFKFFVEPWIEKVSEECLQSPNPVMKLLIVFSSNVKYFPLLARKCGNASPMDVIMGLLNSDKVYFNVKNCVLEIIERLLTLEEEADEKETATLMYMDNTTKKSLKKKRPYGAALLLPHVSAVLEYLRKSLVKKYVKLDGVYMLILRRISEFGLNAVDSAALLGLLVPILKSKATAEEHITLPLLDTILNLLKVLESDAFEEYLMDVASLFNVIAATEVRQKLCAVVEFVFQRTGTQFVNAEFVRGLNARDKRWLDQPDYAARLETFKRVNDACEKGELNFYTGVFVVYNCFYMIKTEKDMALRDHSGLCLKRISPSLVEHCGPGQSDILLNTVLLPLMKEGIQGGNENYQLESLMLFGHLVRVCSTMHPVFSHLHVLSDTSNLENDFFENIQHLQSHRRIKALKRFVELMSEVVKPPSPYSLMFLLPLITRSLMKQKTSKEPGLIACSIDALKVICRLSPWRLYERVLKQYLAEMRKDSSLRKQGIRVVSAVLDAFHFDISQATDDGRLPALKRVPANAESEEEEEKPESPDVDDVEPGVKERAAEPAVKRVAVLCRSDAVRVYRSIKSFLVPSVNRIFMMYDDKSQYHKLSKKITNDEEELAVLSLPIALAAVKLLKQLPRALLDEYISVVFLKLSTYLKSHLPSIRLVARETMQNILMEIGSSYFPKLLSEMMSILTKGSGLHVLVFTCHAILEKIQSLFTAGQMDACVDPVLEICIVDLFGKLAEEKEVSKIVGKTEEAKGNKSYNMLSIVAEYASVNRIGDIIHPFEEIISNSMSSEIVEKVSKSLNYIALGLTRNQFIDAESLLEFAFGVSNGLINNESNAAGIESVNSGQKPDSFLIPQEPRHLTAGKKEICVRANKHVMNEFSLKLLELLLKRDIVKASQYRRYLGPFVPIITDSLQSRYIKLNELALKCLIWLLKRDQTLLNENTSLVCTSVFLILGKYSSASVSGENARLIVSAIEVAVVLIRDLKHEIDNDQLRTLLMVVEDMQKNVSHSENAFSLLRAIIGRRFNIPELHELMRKTAELSICSYNDKIRLNARKVFYHYLLNYPLGKKLRRHVMFYASQLKYEEATGRKSALEMLTVLTNVFPLDVLLELSSLLFVQLAFRLITDDSAECKKMAADCIAKILTRVEGTKQENELFDVVLIWMKEKKVLNRRLAVQLLGVFVAILKEKFVPKLPKVLPLVENQLHLNSSDGPGKYVKAPKLAEPADAAAENDQLIFQVLQLYKTLMETCPMVLTESSYTEPVQLIAENCQFLLRHSHEWVRLGAAQVLGIIFKSIDSAEVASMLNKKQQWRETGFLRDRQTREQIRGLCLDLCDQLAAGHNVMEQLLRQTMKNLLFLAEILQNLPITGNKKDLSLRWLVSRLIKQVNREVAFAPQEYTVRSMVFNWLAALAVKFAPDKLVPLLPVVLVPVMRELTTTDQQGVTIRRVAKEVLKYYRQKTNTDEYDKTVIRVQKFLDIKRAKRKMQVAQMAVTHPERSAKSKLKKQQKKKEQQKRRKEKLRKRKFKKKKVVTITP